LGVTLRELTLQKFTMSAWRKESGQCMANLSETFWMWHFRKPKQCSEDTGKHQSPRQTLGDLERPLDYKPPSSKSSAIVLTLS